MLSPPPASSPRVFASFSTSDCESSGEGDTKAPRLRGLPLYLERFPPQLRSLGFDTKQLAIVVVVALVVAIMVVEARVVHQPRVSDNAAADPQRAPLHAASLYSSTGADTVIIGSLPDAAGATLPHMHTQPPMPLLGDESCPGGIRSGRVCCAASCGLCGDANCGDRRGGRARCCASTIRAAAQLCSTHAAPCLVDLNGDALHRARSGAAASDAVLLDGALGDKWGRAIGDSATARSTQKADSATAARSAIPRLRRAIRDSAIKTTPNAIGTTAARYARGFAAPRVDMRCGSKFEHAACAHDSASPCCSRSGWCGASNKHCAGRGTFDHRNRELCNPAFPDSRCDRANPPPLLQRAKAALASHAPHVGIDEALVARGGRDATVHLKQLVAAHLRAYHAAPAAAMRGAGAGAESGRNRRVDRLKHVENAITEALIAQDIGRAAAAPVLSG